VIAYSPDAEPARAFLLRNYNDLDIYVEDAACQNMYIRLFNRMLERKKKRITSVFPLNGRKNLIDRCRADQAANPRRRLYVMDADQDLILGRLAPRLKHLYRLRVYCSENLLLSESAAILIGTECRTSRTWHDMAVDLSLRKLIEESIRILLPLFVAYAVVYELGLNIETTSFPIQRLLKDPNDPTTLSKRLVENRIRSITKEIRSLVALSEYRRVRNLAAATVLRNPNEHAAYLSGKTYLLPLVHLHLRKIASLRDTQEGLKVRLAQHCELNIDPGLSRAILRAAK
jgi:Protein of unknown function (DUF4435)